MDKQGLLERSRLNQRESSQIPGHENGEPLVVLKPNKRLKLVPIWQEPVDDIEGPLYQKYVADNPSYNAIYVRQAVASKLNLAASNLPDNWQLIVRAGHRPLTVQQQLLEDVKLNYLQENPKATQSQALEFARTYVADPSIKLPPHCCGAAVDVDVLDLSSGQLIDFGCAVNTDAPIAFLYSDQVSPDQAQNRQLLLTAMLQAGFASNPNEWWHYSYGDQAWAWFYSQPTTLYKIKEVITQT